MRYLSTEPHNPLRSARMIGQSCEGVKGREGEGVEVRGNHGSCPDGQNPCYSPGTVCRAAHTSLSPTDGVSG
jgi:hypothetical protein